MTGGFTYTVTRNLSRISDPSHDQLPLGLSLVKLPLLISQQGGMKRRPARQSGLSHVPVLACPRQMCAA